MQISKTDLAKIRIKMREYYKSVGHVYCPYFEEEIIFNSKGFMHLIYDNPRQQRSRDEQYFRLKVLPKGVEMLSITTVVQEYEERMIGNRMTRFWGFIGIINNQKIKVIIRQNGNGKKHFYSIFPKWTTRKSVEK